MIEVFLSCLKRSKLLLTFLNCIEAVLSETYMVSSGSIQANRVILIFSSKIDPLKMAEMPYFWCFALNIFILVISFLVFLPDFEIIWQRIRKNSKTCTIFQFLRDLWSKWLATAKKVIFSNF